MTSYFYFLQVKTILMRCFYNCGSDALHATAAGFSENYRRVAATSIVKKATISIL